MKGYIINEIRRDFSHLTGCGVLVSVWHTRRDKFPLRQCDLTGARLKNRC
jgi:hypothetical protein